MLAGLRARSRTLSTWWDKWIIDGIGVNGPAIVARMMSYPARLFEWGLVQWYALVMVAGLLGFAFVLRVANELRARELRASAMQIARGCSSQPEVIARSSRLGAENSLCRITFFRSFSSRRWWARSFSCSFPRRTKTRSAGWRTSSRFGGFLISLPLVPWFWAQRFDPGFKFIEGAVNNWIPSIGAGYILGIDGISFLLIMLTTLLGWISILSSWTAIEIRVKEYYIWFLMLQTGMLGVFMALDFFLFFVFWEAMLVPMYLLIGIWGGPRKLYAAIKFFLYTLARLGADAAGHPVPVFPPPHARRAFYTFSYSQLYRTAPQIPVPGDAHLVCSLASLSDSRSRCRCSRSTPGCRMRTWKRRPPAP